MHINSVVAGAVEISRQRPKDALQVRRTAGRVVPWITDLISRRRIKRQRVAIAVRRSIERHPRVYAVVERPLDNIGELTVSSRRQHPPAPHHVADGGTALSISAEIRQFVGITEGLPIGP